MISLTEKRQSIWQEIQPTKLCAVTKNRSIEEVASLLADLPDLTIIAENRWPDCEEKFRHFQQLERHFIGQLQTNKVRKVLPLVDVIQSIDSLKLLDKVQSVAAELDKKVEFYFQVNISEDPQKGGFAAPSLPAAISQYIAGDYPNTTLTGLMTIGTDCTPENRRPYFQKFKQLFDKINTQFFTKNPLKNLSMGMSADYQIAISEGSTIIRLGSALFNVL